ncbi:MAG: transcription-repair coupling factor [Gemmatimonadetes bacterium]|nr:transcription-repair coupling factor [Gemmatimonadota bacterium]
MSPNLILDAVASCPPVRDLAGRLPAPAQTVALGGAVGSLAAAVVAALHRARADRVFICVAESPQAAAAAQADLDTLLDRDGESHLYPQKEALPYEESEPHLEIGGLRVEAVEALLSGRVRLIVTTPRALQERVPVPAHFATLRQTFRVGDTVEFTSLPSTLEARGFERVPLVEEVGQFAVRGGILDVFSVAAGDPVRIEFWGDEIASIRLFDVLDQRSKSAVSETHVLPTDFRREAVAGDETVTRSLAELLPGDAVVTRLGAFDLAHETERTWSRARELYHALVESGSAPHEPKDLFVPPDELRALLDARPRLDLLPGPEVPLRIEAAPPPVIARDMEVLESYLRVGTATGQRTLLLCDNDGQLVRLEEILGGATQLPAGTQLGLGTLATGFELRSSDPPLRVLNDHEIFRRSRRLRRSRHFRGAVALESLAQLTPGDYVVHMDHGVGRFVGLQHIAVAGEELESLAIEYEGGEILRVPVYRLDLVERWVGESDDAKPPKLHSIGGKRWKALKQKTEQAIEQMTIQLLDLYARRQATQAFGFAPDSKWQMEMESSFLYDDTPDQRQAALDVKKDMESTRPMDRLLCGDVGYGKTEVSIRAAFKAVQEGKQVAVLAPTTILVEQHRHTFAERLADYPVRVGALSRFRTPKEQSDLLAALAEGSVDIVIGTHRLLSEDVVFKDLGLLVIDEEQRFGVKHKERLKSMRTSVHVLALTATPIPRTLYLSLSGIRDLSIIRTPPRDRMPIYTNVLPWSDQLISDALHRELDRGGQTFFLHNRIDTIYTIAEELRALVPEARVAVAHGQMKVDDLDEVMRAFVDGEVDVLVCSSIIENGLDVPNANTLLVDRADRFGLAQLYQIRGRVGRSDRRAYCYLLVPDEIGDDAERRLRVLEHYTELGSGYSVAVRDLELRGAGNLLGADQSGFAQQIGLDAYMRLLKRTVERIQKGEQAAPEWPDPEVSLGGAAYLPDGYVSDSGQKLHLYRRLSKLGGLGEVKSLRSELTDRFGPPPPEVERLLAGAALRVLGRDVGVEKIYVRGRSARLSFREEVVPKMAALDGPLRRQKTSIEVRRVRPLSVRFEQEGSEPIMETLTVALAALKTAGAAA